MVAIRLDYLPCDILCDFESLLDGASLRDQSRQRLGSGQVLAVLNSLNVKPHTVFFCHTAVLYTYKLTLARYVRSQTVEEHKLYPTVCGEQAA